MLALINLEWTACAGITSCVWRITNFPESAIRHTQWQTSIDLQAGYGNNHGYGTIAVSHRFGWDE